MSATTADRVFHLAVWPYLPCSFCCCASSFLQLACQTACTEFLDRMHTCCQSVQNLERPKAYTHSISAIHDRQGERHFLFWKLLHNLSPCMQLYRLQSALREAGVTMYGGERASHDLSLERAKSDRYACCNQLHSALSSQHSALSSQHSALSTQHSAFV